MKQLYCKMTSKSLEEIKEAIKEGQPFEVNNNYETFAGVEFDSWLAEGVKDLVKDIEITRWDNVEDYPRTYIITPNN